MTRKKKSVLSPKTSTPDWLDLLLQRSPLKKPSLSQKEKLRLLDSQKLTTFLRENEDLELNPNGLKINFKYLRSRLELFVYVPEGATGKDIKAAAPIIAKWRRRLTQ